MNISLLSFTAIGPQLILTTVATILLLLGVYRVSQSWVVGVALAGYFLAGASLSVASGHHFPYAGAISSLYNDHYTLVLFALFLLSGAIVSLLSVRYLELHNSFRSEYFALVMFAVVGMMLMAASQDLLVMYLGLELMSLTSYVLAGYLIPLPRSQEAALKYFLTGALGSAIFLFGVAYLYGATGSIAYTEIGRLAWQSMNSHSFFAFGTTFLLAGFAFKVAAVPFHMWAPDVYHGSPTPITAFMAVGVKTAAFGVLARVVVVSIDIGHNVWFDMILAGLCAGTMIWGNLAAIAQRDIKRMMAYSSIAHAGYLLLAITARTTWTGPSLLFYLFAYALTTLGAFSVIAVFENAEGKHLDIDSYAGLASRYPILSVCLTISFLSLAGIPPTLGFVGKWFVFGGAVVTGHGHLLALAVLGVVTSLVSVYYYMRVVYLMFMVPSHEQSAHATSAFPIEQRLSIALAVGVILFGIFPPVAMTQHGTLRPIAKTTRWQTPSPSTPVGTAEQTPTIIPSPHHPDVSTPKQQRQTKLAPSLTPPIERPGRFVNRPYVDRVPTTTEPPATSQPVLPRIPQTPPLLAQPATRPVLPNTTAQSAPPDTAAKTPLRVIPSSLPTAPTPSPERKIP